MDVQTKPKKKIGPITLLITVIVGAAIGGLIGLYLQHSDSSKVDTSVPVTTATSH